MLIWYRIYQIKNLEWKEIERKINKKMEKRKRNKRLKGIQMNIRSQKI